MASIESIFTFDKSVREEQKKLFLQYIKDNVSGVFSQMGNVRYHVPHIRVLATINHDGKDREVWNQISNIIPYIQPNSDYSKMHKSQIFYMIHRDSGGSYIKMINRLKKFVKEFAKTDLQFNKVKYGYEDNYSRMGRFI